MVNFPESYKSLGWVGSPALEKILNKIFVWDAVSNCKSVLGAFLYSKRFLGGFPNSKSTSSRCSGSTFAVLVCNYPPTAPVLTPRSSFASKL